MLNAMTASTFAETDFSDLVGSIYDAALAPERWSGVLEACREFSGGFSAAIFAKNVTGSRTRLYHADSRIKPEVSSS